jgi:UDP-N-acetylglucosamine--N-acetylmuramyl-(pentapeptide) pyrophosphoryl-undecaprenol N-acetylglucosamine transferase
LRLIVTGGGTGGHVYPALEVARLAGERGAELLFLGSIRGQEGKLCEQRGMLFKGFPAEPLYSLRTPRGWRALSRLLRARKMARAHLAAARPDVVFSTGGYSAGPVLAAARSLGIPYVIHDGNSVPGRSNRMFGRGAKAFLSTFYATERLYTDRPVVRTGQPIRKQLRDAASAHRQSGIRETVMAEALLEGEVTGTAGVPPTNEDLERATILVLGGSQGSAYLNEAVPTAISAMEIAVDVIHASGPTNFAETSARVKGLSLENYRVEPYLDAEAITDAYCRADLVVCRSGGTLAELAMFGLPSVLVPLPSSADDHQHYNALEFEEMKAAVEASQEAAPYSKTTHAIRAWLSNSKAREEARHKLKEWDVPDATERIVAHIEAAAR